MVIKPLQGGFGGWSEKKCAYVPVSANIMSLLARFGLEGAEVAEVIDAVLDPRGTQDLDVAQIQQMLDQLVELGLLVNATPNPRGGVTRCSAKDAPIFLVGCPRSGTTLLQWLVDAHPEIFCPTESKLLPALRTMWHDPRFSRSVVAQVGCDTALKKMREFAESIVRGPWQRSGKRRWADKTPDHVFCLDFIDRLYGHQPRFVFIVRHAFDVALSLDEVARPGLDSFITRSTEPYVLRHDFRLEAMARYWADVNRTILSFCSRTPERTFVLRYEQLVAAPEATLRAMFEFLGEQWDPALVERAFVQHREPGVGDPGILGTRSIHDKRIGRWKHWRPGVCEALTPLVARELAALGYDPIEGATT